MGNSPLQKCAFFIHFSIMIEISCDVIKIYDYADTLFFCLFVNLMILSNFFINSFVFFIGKDINWIR